VRFGVGAGRVEYATWTRESPEWAASRARFRRHRRARRCAFHGRSCYVVQAHHWARLFYRYRGRERPWMLVSLCDPVHAAAHGLSRWVFGHHLRGLPATTLLVVTVGKLLQVVVWAVTVTLGGGRR